MRTRSWDWRGAAATLLCVALAACGGGGSADATPTTGTASGGSGAGADGVGSDAALSPAAQLGAKIFSDPSLSASGRQSCASCHDPASAHGAPNALAAQFGGPALDQQGSRSAGSIRYLATNTAFHFAADGTPTGGFFWDGRADSLQQQAGAPLLNPKEMANASKADVVAKLARSAYAGEFRALYGDAIFDDADAAFQRLTLAVQQFELESPAFRPFSSRYDEFLRGKLRLTDQEMRGLALYNSPAKGNCAACHPSGRGADGSFPLFTDFSYDNLGVPRNPELASNTDPAYFDLGLCGRPELAQRSDLCGAFKVPSLRNVAVRKRFFHNGRFKTLKEAVTFYAQRDTAPEKWYPLNADGSVTKFDDVPPADRRNVNTQEAPLNRHLGDAPALSDAEVDDLVAFLGTLTDADIAAH
jgi:cytochrome c peroxidase